MMKSYNLFQTMMMAIVMVTFGLGASVSMAASTKIAGQFKQAYTKQEALPVPQTQGHMIMLTQANGINSDTNGSGFMDGAKVVIQEIIDLNQGNGPSSGYVTETMPNGDEVVVKINGDVSTILTADGQPNTSFTGKWLFKSGTGQYKGIKGSGTYKGHFTAEKEFVVDWNGYYFLQ